MVVELYLRHDCPFCNKVIDYVRELKLKSGTDYRAIDAAKGTPGSGVVLKVGGKPQVPFMVDDNVHMYESDDIIEYLKDKFSQAE